MIYWVYSPETSKRQMSFKGKRDNDRRKKEEQRRFSDKERKCQSLYTLPSRLSKTPPRTTDLHTGNRIRKRSTINKVNQPSEQTNEELRVSENYPSRLQDLKRSRQSQ